MTQKEGSRPLGHTAPRGFIPWERKFGGLAGLPLNNQKEGSLPLGHMAPSTYSQPNSLSRVYSHFHQQGLLVYIGLQVYIAVSAKLEQLNPRGTRPPKPHAADLLAYRTLGPTTRGRWGRRDRSSSRSQAEGE